MLGWDRPSGLIRLADHMKYMRNNRMPNSHEITINGTSFIAKRGELLLDAALRSGVSIPHQCRSGHCGTCCVRLTSGRVHGGEARDPDIVHACQCRIAGEAEFETISLGAVREVGGTLAALRHVTSEVTEIGIRIDYALPHHPGQYARVQFKGFPERAYSITQPVYAAPDSRSVWFHIRRLKDGHVSPALGHRIALGHRVILRGPYGSAHYRPMPGGRLILVATNTGFAPIWAIAIAALRENPSRRIMIIVGGRTLESLYMAPALARLAQFPNVFIVPVCSGPYALPSGVMPGRPTDYLPKILSTDALYACGAPEMVNSIKSIAANFGATCYADPFVPSDEAPRPPNGRSRNVRKIAIPSERPMLQLPFARSVSL